MEPVLVCHGSPNRNNEKMLANDDHTASVIKQCSKKYILCGHTHIRQVIEDQGKLVLNPGSVGLPLHSKGKAQFLILHSNKSNWEHEFIDLDYDKDVLIRVLKESGLFRLAPCWSQITGHLLLTGEISHGTVLSRAMKYCIEETGDCKWYDIPEKYWEKAVNELLL